MPAQSRLADNGIRFGTLGSVASLAIAFPLIEGGRDVAAHTDAVRIGVYASRTSTQEKLAAVVMGTEVGTFQSHVDRASLTLPGAIKIGGYAGTVPLAGMLRWTGTAFEGYNGVSWGPLGGGGGGTVTSVSVVSANGFAGTVATATTTPAITLTTTITGLLKGNGTAISAAVAGTDYLAPFGSQTANTVYAAPNGVAGTPSFRALVAADIPALSYIGGTASAGLVAFGSGANTLTSNAAFTYSAVSGQLGVNAIQLNAALANPAASEGLLFWDSTQRSLAYWNNSVYVHLGQEQVVEVRNQTGSTLSVGAVVYISGASGNKPLVSLADNTTDLTSRIIGIVHTAIANNGNGYVVTSGIASGMNTSAFVDGDTLWLTTAGGVTATQPTDPTRQILIGRVIRAHVSLGQILVAPVRYPTLADLSDVATASVATGDLLRWNGTTWANSTLAAAGITSGSAVAGQMTYWSGANAITGSATLTYDATPSTGGLTTSNPIKIQRGTLTAASPSIDTTATWNNAAVTFAHTRFSITDTASNAASLLMDMQVNAASVLTIAKDGTITNVGNHVMNNVQAADSTRLDVRGRAQFVSFANTTAIAYFGHPGFNGLLLGGTSQGVTFEVAPSVTGASVATMGVFHANTTAIASAVEWGYGLDRSARITKSSGATSALVGLGRDQSGTDTTRTLVRVANRNPTATLALGSGVRYFEVIDYDSTLSSGTDIFYIDNSRNVVVGAGQAITASSTTARASLRIPHGTAPTTPTNGDVWTTTAGLFIRINGTTVGPLGTGGGTPGGSNTQIQYNNSGSFAGSPALVWTGTQFIVNNNAATLPAAPTGTVAQFGSADGTLTRVLVDSFGTGVRSTFAGRSARNTAAAPSALQSGDEITHLSAWGYGATGYSAAFRAAVSMLTAEAWTDTAQGTRIAFITTAPGGTTTSEKVRVWGDGGVSIGGAFAASPGASALSIAAQFDVAGMAAPAVSASGAGRIYFDSSTNRFRVSQNGSAYANLIDVDFSQSVFIEAPTNKTYTIVERMSRAGTVVRLAAKLASGTCTLNVQINGVSVTSLNAIAATSTQSVTAATGANTLAVGDRVTVIVTNASAPVDLALTLEVSEP